MPNYDLLTNNGSSSWWAKVKIKNVGKHLFTVQGKNKQEQKIMPGKVRTVWIKQYFNKK